MENNKPEIEKAANPSSIPSPAETKPIRAAPSFTEGPWVARQEYLNHWRIGAAKSPVSVAIVTTTTTVGEVGTNEHQTEANARLIAAAPDLLAALKATLAAMRNARDTWPNYEPDVQWVDAWDAARAVIAKVEKG